MGSFTWVVLSGCQLFSQKPIGVFKVLKLGRISKTATKKETTVRRSSFLVDLFFLAFPPIQVGYFKASNQSQRLNWVGVPWQVWVGPCPKNLDPLAVHAMSSKGLTLFSIPRADGRLCSILSWNDTTGCVGKMVGKWWGGEAPTFQMLAPSFPLIPQNFLCQKPDSPQTPEGWKKMRLAKLAKNNGPSFSSN